MIVGLGVDLCRIERIRRSVTRFGKDWLNEVFTEGEQKLLGEGDERAQRAAIGFAIKEASSKAIGTGFGNGVRRQDIVIVSADDRYSVHLAGAAKQRAARLSMVTCRIHTRFRRTDQWVNAVALLATADDQLDVLLDEMLSPLMIERVCGAILS